MGKVKEIQKNPKGVGKNPKKEKRKEIPPLDSAPNKGRLLIMETATMPNRRTDSYYQSSHVLVSPMKWIELHFRVHSVEGRFRTVDLWVVNTKDECAPVQFNLDHADARFWGFEKDHFLLYPGQNGIEGSPNNNYCIDFCRFLWGHLQQYHWTPKTGGKQP